MSKREIRDLWRAVARAYDLKGGHGAAAQARLNAKLAGA